MAPVDGRNITNWSPLTQTSSHQTNFRSAEPWGQRKLLAVKSRRVRFSSAFFSLLAWGGGVAIVPDGCGSIQTLSLCSNLC